MTGTAEHYRSVWEQAVNRLTADQAIPARPWPLTDADVPLIGIQALGEYPGMAWALRRDSTARPANKTDAARYASQKADAEWAAANGDPYCVLPFTPNRWAVPDPPQPHAATCPMRQDASAVLASPIAQMAAERVASDDTAARFLALHAAEDKRTATAQIEAVGDTTQVITEGGPR